MENKVFPHFATNALHVGQEPEQWKSLAVIPPISMATTFKQFSPGDHAGYDYSRSGNPTRTCLEKCIASLENAKYAYVFSSGLATTDAFIHSLYAGDHIISSDDVYGGTNRYFRYVAKHHNIELSFVDMRDPKNVAENFKDNTKMVWIETPTNPLLKLADIEAIAKMAHEKSKKCIVVVDNTFCSPYFQRPLDLGADFVIHSMTKYMNGHSDVVMGCMATNHDEMAEQFNFQQKAIGSIPSPIDCYLVNRGLKTLHLRMEEHQKNGLAVAKWLEKDKRVEKVVHPGLQSHPQYELGCRQMKGYSGMVTFFIKGGEKEACAFLKNLKVFTLAESLGGFESLAEHPAIMTHASVVKEEREKLGIYDNLIRLSVGLETLEDLIADLDQALASAVA